MNQDQLQLLLEKYQNGICTEEEYRELEHWFHELNYKEVSFASWVNEAGGESALLQSLYANLKQRLPIKRKMPVLVPYYKIVAAAVILITLSFVLYFYSGKFLHSSVDGVITKNDVPPGKNTATLTLANGKTIALSDAKNGVVVNATRIVYNDGTSLRKDTPQNDEQIILNTPRGGQYQVVLSDGTKVWLNASSSLSFQSSFARTKKRVIILNGEAYFEVAKDKNKPFIVQSSGQEIEVLGTHFNVNSYANEQEVATTLLEGSVKLTVSSSKVVRILSPGQQAVLKNTDIAVNFIDTDEAVAWRNNEFMFINQPLEKIMNSLSRWYNVEVTYEEIGLKKEVFGGTISRSESLSKVLGKLASTGHVHFKIEGRRVAVMK